MTCGKNWLIFTSPPVLAGTTPKILFSYNLGTRRITRLANFFGGGFYTVTLSPGRRYLAVINGPHISAMCPPKAWLRVLDQWTGKLAVVAEGMAMEEHLAITALHWTTPLSFDFQGEMTMNQKCSEEDLSGKPIPVKRTVEIKQLIFK